MKKSLTAFVDTWTKKVFWVVFSPDKSMVYNAIFLMNKYFGYNNINAIWLIFICVFGVLVWVQKLFRSKLVPILTDRELYTKKKEKGKIWAVCGRYRIDVRRKILHSMSIYRYFTLTSNWLYRIFILLIKL